MFEYIRGWQNRQFISLKTQQKYTNSTDQVIAVVVFIVVAAVVVIVVDIVVVVVVVVVVIVVIVVKLFVARSGSQKLRYGHFRLRPDFSPLLPQSQTMISNHGHIIDP